MARVKCFPGFPKLPLPCSDRCDVSQKSRPLSRPRPRSEAAHGGDTKRMALAGQSAGAHLCSAPPGCLWVRSESGCAVAVGVEGVETSLQLKVSIKLGIFWGPEKQKPYHLGPMLGAPNSASRTFSLWQRLLLQRCRLEEERLELGSRALASCEPWSKLPKGDDIGAFWDCIGGYMGLYRGYCNLSRNASFFLLECNQQFFLEMWVFHSIVGLK